MHHLAIAAVATALFVGAGASALTGSDPQSTTNPQSDTANPMIAGQAMPDREDIFAGASNSPEHTILAGALKVAGAGEMLRGRGPFTIFAPTDAAYAALGRSAGSVMSAPQRAALARSVRYLIVPGRLDSRALLQRIAENGGSARLKTEEGGMIVAQLNGPTNITLLDEKGNVADISIYDIYQSNGVIHVVDKVLLPG